MAVGSESAREWYVCRAQVPLARVVGIMAGCAVATHGETAAGVPALVMGDEAFLEAVCTIACGAALLFWPARSALVGAREAMKVVRAEEAIRQVFRIKDQRTLRAHKPGTL